ncbi:MAG TPA: MFS transporter, partial [Rariglobus sp.]|nr:MFS transporter [Rariglobus sp.]
CFSVHGTFVVPAEYSPYPPTTTYMIVTRQGRVPWSWVWLSQLPFAFWMFTTCLQNTTFTLSLRKFVDNPAVIAATVSLASLPVLVIAPLVNYCSDRIWTRFGRRKPFYVVSNSVGAGCMALMPLAPDYWTLTALLWAFQAANAFGKTFFPLSQEVIPVHQRGRGSAIHTVMFQAGIVLYYSCMLGRFDDVYAHGPLSVFGPLDGERFTYWICALLMLLPLLLVAFGIKEIPIPGALGFRNERTGPRLGLLGFLRKFIVDVFDRQWAVLYLLLFGGALYGLGLGPLQALLYTEQWGYSLQDMGTNVALGTLIMMPLVAACGWIADRYSKLRVYLAAMGAATVLNLVYFLFVTFALPDRRPALWQILLFGELIAICGQVISIVSWPLIFEYIPRKSMGTASAGMEMMHSVFGAALPPLVGLWVAGYSFAFLAPAGPRVEFVLATPALHGEIAASLAPASLGPVHLDPLPAPGQDRAAPAVRWSVRAESADASALLKTKKKLELDLATAQRAKPVDPARLDALRGELTALEAGLFARADAFRHTLASTLGARLVPDGGQIVAARWAESPTLILPATDRLSRRQIATLDRELRAAWKEVIQVESVSVLPGADPAAQSARIVLSPDTDLTVFMPRLRTALAVLPADPERPSEHLGQWTRFKRVFTLGVDPPPATLRAELAGALDLAALAPAASVPVLRLELATLSPASSADLESLQAALRSTGRRALRLDPLATVSGLLVHAAYWEFPPATGDGTTPATDAGLHAALAAASPEPARLTASLALYADARTAAATRGLVVPQPVTRAGFAPREYDYFSAYLITIAGGILGILITLLVARLERRGVIRKLGVEEEQAVSGHATTP